MNRISIERFKESNLHLISKWRSSPEINRFLRPGIHTLDEVQAWYSGYFAREENRLFSISCNDTVIGYFTVEGIDQVNRKCEFGIVIGETAFQNKGIGLATITMMLDKVFNDMGLHRVLAVINEDNIPSVRCFSRAGFVL